MNVEPIYRKRSKRFETMYSLRIYRDTTTHPNQKLQFISQERSFNS